jgi:effector-binding domain-containing protein
MEYAVHVQRVEPQLTGVIRCRAKQSELAQVIPPACGEVWEFMRSSGLPRPGRHLALYLDCEMNIEVGVEVFQSFAGNGRVVCSSTPAGLVATTAHLGPYNRLGEAHAAVHKWCAEQGHALAGPSWEVYGHWEDDPAKLRTDVFWLLKADGAAAEATPAPP